MHKAKKKHSIIRMRYDPISPEHNFSKVLAIELGNDTSDEGSLEECLCKLSNVLDEGDAFVSPSNLVRT